jgi:ubiquinone/menaquinone biosynthesis C-methylase UbiE
MRVLDVGSGAGDVSFLVARMVGPEGCVHGIDKSPEAIRMARERAAEAGLTQVTFEVADAEGYIADLPFDAVVGRLVLAYQADPARLLGQLRQSLKSPGLMAFVELEVSSAKSVPALPLFSRCVAWLTQTFTRARVQVDMGTQLHAAFCRAGFPSPSMFLLSRVEGGESTATYENLVQTLRTLLPTMEQLEIASAAEVQIDTLLARLVAEARGAGAVVLAPAAIGAWVSLP